MKILGIDPGLTRLGFGLVKTEGPRNLAFVDVGVFTTNAQTQIDHRIGQLAASLRHLVDKHRPDLIAIERVFAQSNLKSVMGVAQISGVVLSLAFERDIPVVFHTPSEVKLAVTGSGRADKAQVGFMVAKILKLEAVPKPADAADSLAIAICSAWNSPSLASSASETAAQKSWLAAEAKAKQHKG